MLFLQLKRLMLKLEDQTILIISNEPWGDMWYSKHNWANELSNKNKVYFINPPEKWSPTHLFSSNTTVTNYSKSLSIVDYNNRFPFTRNEIIFRVNEFFTTKSILPFPAVLSNLVNAGYTVSINDAVDGTNALTPLSSNPDNDPVLTW